MSVQLNHTIVWCRDKQRSATFLTEILGLSPPVRLGPVLVVELGNGVSLDFHDTDDEIAAQHCAFLLGEDDFDRVFGPEVGFMFYLDRRVDFIAGRRRRPIEPVTVAMVAALCGLGGKGPGALIWATNP